MNLVPDKNTPTGAVWDRIIREARAEAAEKAKAAAAPTPPRHVTGQMNKTEAAFARKLDGMKAAGEVVRYRFETIKLRLGVKCYYTPDFLVWFADGRQVFMEVKGGHVYEDSIIKWKWASDTFPEYGWEMWQRAKGEFVRVRAATAPAAKESR